MPLRSTADKLKTVREKNTYYFNNELFEKEMQSHIDKLIFLVLDLQKDMIKYDCTKDVLNRDWEDLKDHFNIPINMKEIDFTKVTLKSNFKK